MLLDGFSSGTFLVDHSQNSLDHVSIVSNP